MINPQLEDGYTKIADEILENMAKVKLTPTQYRIIFAVWRYTYGFNRKNHHLSISFLAKATGCSERLVRRSVQQMIEQKILLEKGTQGQTRILEFNKRFSEWGEVETDPAGIVPGLNRPEDYTDPSRPVQADRSRPVQIDPQDIQKRNIYTDHDRSMEIQNAYFNAFGVLATQHNLEVMSGYLEDGLTEWHICEALKRTAENNKRSFRYTMGILNNWLAQKALTPEAVELLDKEFGRGVTSGGSGQVGKDGRPGVHGTVNGVSQDRGSSKWDHLYDDCGTD